MYFKDSELCISYISTLSFQSIVKHYYHAILIILIWPLILMQFLLTLQSSEFTVM